MTEIPSPPPPVAGAVDQVAQEEDSFVSQRPQVPELAASHRRYIFEIDELRKALFWGARWFVRVIAILLILAVFIWWWHVLMPVSWRWLTPEEIIQIQAMIFSGALSALVAIIGKKVL